MKTFFELLENIRSADKRPEIYTKPDGKKGTRMVPVDREVIKQEKTLEWLKSALAREAKATKPRQDDMEEQTEATMYCKDCGCERGNPDPNCTCPNDNAKLTDAQCTSEQSKCKSRKEDVKELTIADVQKATAMAKKRQAKEREAGKKSVSTADLAARMPKKEDMNPYLKHPANKLKAKHASFNRQLGDLQTKKLKGAKNPSIDQEIAKYQQKLRHVKNAMKSEDVKLDEISPELQKSYKKKAMKQYKQSARQKDVGGIGGTTKQSTADKHMKTFTKRHKGIGSAIKRQGGSPKTNRDPKANSMTGKPAPYQNESFKPHMMYDPKTGKGYKADKEADHLRMKKMGYTHDDPSTKKKEEGVKTFAEISKGMAARYIKKAQVSTADAAKSTERGYTDSRSPDRDIAKAGKTQAKKGIKTFINRNKGTSTAVDKLTGKAKVPAKESKGIDAMKKAGNAKADAEAADRKKMKNEISNNKMGQYVRKAAGDAAKKGAAGDTDKAKARVKGVSKAMDKMDKNRLFGRSE